MYKLLLYSVLSRLVLGAILDHPSNRTTSLCPNGVLNKAVPLYIIIVSALFLYLLRLRSPTSCPPMLQ